jgi:hypoxanthine phosphoribosyltransferase
LKLDGVAAPGGVELVPADSQLHLQRSLPLPWRLARTKTDPGFAHPAELEFAKILTFYRIRWVYEPTTFALTYTPDGRPREMFTPDFYLPDHHLYIELTTMRQQLVTRKNKKLRMMREHHPNVRIKLIYRRDYHRLVDAYRSGEHRSDDTVALAPLLSEEIVGARIAAMATEIVASTPSGTQLLLLTTGDGALRFGRELAEALVGLGLRIETDSIRQNRFQTEDGIRRVRVLRQPLVSIEGRRVLLVTDIVSTGMSLHYLVQWVRNRGAQAIEVCTMLDRSDARLIDVPITYAGFTAPSELIVGYGMPLRRQYGDIPHLATVTSDPRS